MDKRRLIVLSTACALVCLGLAGFLSSENDHSPKTRSADHLESISKQNDQTGTFARGDSRARPASRLKTLRDGLIRTRERPQENEIELFVEAEALARLEIMKRTVGPLSEKQVQNAFNSLIDEEYINAGWTKQKRDALLELLRNEKLANSSLDDINCYQLLCKIEMTHSSEEARETFSKMGIGAEQGIDGPALIFSAKQANGTVKSTSYMGRVGNDFEIDKRLTERLYREATGRSPSEVVPTESEVEEVVAAFTPKELMEDDENR